MEKDFIDDDGKIRMCDANISKMSVFEFMYCYIFHWRYFSRILSRLYECLEELFIYGCGFIYNLLILLFTPITLFLCAIVQIKESKKRLSKK